MRTRIKFCGLTRTDDVAAAVALGVDAVGLIFAPRSPRCLDVARARGLRASLPPFVAAVALLMDNPIAQVQRIVEIVRPQLLQFHGSEDEPDCARYGMPYLRAVPMGGTGAGEAPRDGESGDAAAFVARYPSATGFVFDSHARGGAGGSGERFDWSRLPAGLQRPWLLAGGLEPDNVHDAVRRTRPYGVDVSSGIESAPGIKDHERMRRFVMEVRRADGEHG